MNIKELREMISLMKENDLIELEIEKEGERIRLKKEASGMGVREDCSHARFIPAPQMSNDSNEGGSSKQEQANDKGTVIRSPMVGTFYSSPAPDQDPYVTKGQMVKEGDVLCIIEAMKLMNEIKAEISGKVLEVMATNGQPVEFDQPLYKIEKS